MQETEPGTTHTQTSAQVHKGSARPLQKMPLEMARKYEVIWIWIQNSLITFQLKQSNNIHSHAHTCTRARGEGQDRSHVRKGRKRKEPPTEEARQRTFLQLPSIVGWKSKSVVASFTSCVLRPAMTSKETRDEQMGVSGRVKARQTPPLVSWQ